MIVLLQKQVALLRETSLANTPINLLSGDVYIAKYFSQEELALYKNNTDLYFQKYGYERQRYLTAATLIQYFDEEGMPNSKIRDRMPPAPQPQKNRLN